MKEIRIVVADDSALRILYAEWWELVAIQDRKFYLDREIKKTRAEKKSQITPEYLEFKEKYPRKEGITADSLISKYAKALESIPHRDLIDSLEAYRKKWRDSNLASWRPPEDTQFIPMPATWLNQKKYEQKPDAVFVPEKKATVSEMERLTAHLPPDIRKKVTARAIQYLEDHKDKVLTPELISNITNRYA